MGSGFNFFANSIDKTPLTTGAWVDVDSSADIPSGATGVILDIHNTDSVNRNVDVRKNGSTDDDYANAVIASLRHTYAIIGVDANRIFEAKMDSTLVKIYLKGYTDSRVILRDNKLDKSTSTTGSYVDTSVLGDVSEDATGVILKVVNVSTTTAYSFALRKAGSTDDRYWTQGTALCTCHIYAFVGIDANKVFQQKIQSISIDVYLIGYTKPPVTFFTNAIDKSLSTTGTWTDIDLTTDTEASADGAIFEMVNTHATNFYKGELRKNESTDNFSDTANIKKIGHLWGLTGLNTGNICEGYIDSTTVDFYLIGYCKPVVTYTKTYNADALLKKLDIAKTYSGDLLLKKSDITKSYCADALLSKAFTKTYSTDVLLKKSDISKEYMADLLLQKLNIIKTYTADLLLLKPLTKTYLTDVLLKRVNIIKTYSSDVLLVFSQTKTYSTDVLLKKPDVTKIYSADVLLKKSDLMKTYSSDTLLKKFDITKTYSADVFLVLTPLYGIIHSELSMLERGMSFAMKEISQKIELVQRTMKTTLNEISQKIESLERKMKIEAVTE